MTQKRSKHIVMKHSAMSVGFWVDTSLIWILALSIISFYQFSVRSSSRKFTYINSVNLSISWVTAANNFNQKCKSFLYHSSRHSSCLMYYYYNMEVLGREKNYDWKTIILFYMITVFNIGNICINVINKLLS